MKSIATIITVSALVVECSAFTVTPGLPKKVAISRPSFKVMAEQPNRSTSFSYLATLDRTASPEIESSLTSDSVHTTTELQNAGLSSQVSQTSDIAPKTEEEQDKTKQLLQQVKDAGIAGVISYAAWELAFWFVSIPIVLFGYYEFTGHWPDLSNNEDIAKLSAEAFAFVNFARFAVPLRIGLALSTTPWIEKNIVEKFMKDNKQEE